VTRTLDVRHPRLFPLFYAAVLLGAGALLWRFTPTAGPADAGMVLVVLLCMVVAEASPVQVPAGGYVTAGAALDFASLIILGPVYTAWLDLISTFITQGLVLRKPIVRVVFNAAQYCVTTFVAGFAFSAAGGRVGELLVPGDIPALLVCAGAFFATNSVLVSLVIGVTTGPGPWVVWKRTYLTGILHHLSFIALGALLAVVYFGAGPWGVLLLGIPLLLARHSFKQYVEIREDLKDFVRALAEVLEEIDPYTRQHSRRVASYAVQLARGLRIPEREVDELEYAALVHDLGKIAPQHQHLLRKRGRLSEEEQRTMRTHPGAGAEIVAKVRALRRAAEIIRTHHERPDGRGYPFGLKSEDVPIGARVLNVADAFDAMTSDRPYRRALSVAAAVSELKAGAGTQFDGAVVDCLERMLRDGSLILIPSPSSEDLLLLKRHAGEVGG
jgi:putative nucleotidyltransferase with HDIG domain